MCCLAYVYIVFKNERSVLNVYIYFSSFPPMSFSLPVYLQTIEFPLLDGSMSPFVFAVVRRKMEKKIRKATKDLEHYTGI